EHPDTRPRLALGLVREGDEFLPGHSQAEGVVHRERGAEGRRRAYSEPLGYGKRRLAQDLDFHGAGTDHFFDDAPGHLGRPMSLVHEDINRRPRGVSRPRDRLDSKAQREAGAAGTLHPWVRILNDLKEGRDMSRAKSLTLGHHAGLPAKSAPPRALSVLRTPRSDLAVRDFSFLFFRRREIRDGGGYETDVRVRFLRHGREALGRIE